MTENVQAKNGNNGNGDNGSVKRIGWTVYFYADVTPNSQQELISILSSMDLEHQIARLDGYAPQIKLRIHSSGGDVQAALGIVDFIKNMQSYEHLVAIIDGWAASAATIIAIACNKIYMGENGEWLIHQLSGWAYGKLDNIVDFAESGKNAHKRIVALYAKRSNLNKKQIRKKMQREWYLDYNEALRLGLIDGDLSNVR